MKKFLLSFLLLTFPFWASGAPVTPPQNIEAEVSDFAFTSLRGTEVDLSAMKGKVVLVYFWATWCGPCERNVSFLKELHEEFHKDGLEIVGISLDKTPGRVTGFIKTHSLPWPQYVQAPKSPTVPSKKARLALAASGEVAVPFPNDRPLHKAVKSIPTRWLLNKEGVVVTKHAHGNLKASVRELLAPSPSTGGSE